MTSRSKRAVPLWSVLIALTLPTGLVRAETPSETRADFQTVSTDTWWHLGKVYLQPTFALKNIGVNSNVFLSAEDPQRDLTATISPGVRSALKFRDRGFLLVQVRADYIWFENFASQTHLDAFGGGRGVLNLRSMKFFGAAEYKRTSERPNNEIDDRAQRTERLMGAGGSYDVSARAAIDFVYKRNTVTYKDTDYAFQPSCGLRIADASYLISTFCPVYGLGDQLNRIDSAQTLRFSKKAGGRSLVYAETERRFHDFLAEIPPPDATGTVPVIGSQRDTSETRYLVGAEVGAGGTIWGSAKVGRTSIRPVHLKTQSTEATIGAATLIWKMGRVATKANFEHDFYFSIYGRNLYYRQSHAGLEWVVYLNRFLGVQGTFDSYLLVYPVIDPHAEPLFGTPRRDELRKIAAGLRFRITDRTVATISLGRRQRFSNIPGIRDEEVTVSTGVETTF